MRVYSGSQTEKYFLFYRLLACNSVDSIKLLDVIDDEITHALVNGIGDIGICFVVAVEICLFKRKGDACRGVKLARGDDVGSHALLAHDAVHLLERCRLAGVQGKRVRTEGIAHRADVGTAILAYFVFVHKVEGCAVLFRKTYGVKSRKAEVSRLVYR